MLLFFFLHCNIDINLAHRKYDENSKKKNLYRYEMIKKEHKKSNNKPFTSLAAFKFRHAKIMRAPRFARSLAVSRPIPPLAPVIVFKV